MNPIAPSNQPQPPPPQDVTPPSKRVHHKVTVKIDRPVELETVPQWIKDIALMVFKLTRGGDDIEVEVNFDFSGLPNISKADRRKVTNYFEDEVFNLELDPPFYIVKESNK